MLMESSHPSQVNSGRRLKLGTISEIYYSSNISNFHLNFHKSRFLCFDFHRGQCKAESTRARAELSLLVDSADILRQSTLRQKLKTTIEIWKNLVKSRYVCKKIVE